MLGDILKRKRSQCIFLTETWLNPDIVDAEVHIEGYTILRSDCVGRIRGGAAIFMKDELYPKKAASFSNGVVEFIVVKSSILDSLFISIYRPPSTNNDEWMHALTSLDSEIKLAQAHGRFQRIYIGGDFNFGSLR